MATINTIQQRLFIKAATLHGAWLKNGYLATATDEAYQGRMRAHLLATFKQEKLDTSAKAMEHFNKAFAKVMESLPDEDFAVAWNSLLDYLCACYTYNMQKLLVKKTHLYNYITDEKSKDKFTLSMENTLVNLYLSNNSSAVTGVKTDKKEALKAVHTVFRLMNHKENCKYVEEKVGLNVAKDVTDNSSDLFIDLPTLMEELPVAEEVSPEIPF